MAEQLALCYDERGAYGPVWERLRQILADIVHHLTLKEAAYLLDVKPSLLAHCLADRNHNHLRAEWIIPLLHRAPSDAAVELLAELRGLEVRRRDELTPEEELHRLKRVLAEAFGPEIRDSIYRRVKQQ